MNVVVRYLAQLRRLAGRSDERLSLPAGCTVGQLVGRLAAANEAMGRALLDDRGGVRPTILVFVGDEQAAKDRPLEDGDEVVLMTPIAGGSGRMKDEG
jgi:molybdopterin converting factor small subunit